MKNENIKVTFLEMITLNEIKVKHKYIQLEKSKEYIDLLKELSKLNPETSKEEMSKIIKKLESLMNKTNEELKDIQEDKKFVESLLKRELCEKKKA